MKLTNDAVAVFALLPLSTWATSLYNYPIMAPVTTPFTSFESDVVVTEGYDPANTFMCTNGFNHGTLGLEIERTRRRVVFSLSDMDVNNRAGIIEVGEGVEHSTSSGNGGQAWLVHDWKSGEKQRLKVTAEAKGRDTIYSGYFWLDNEWRLIAKMVGLNYGNTGLGFYYQYINNTGDDITHTRRVDYSGQCYRILGSKQCFPVLTTLFTLGQPANSMHGAGINKDGNGVFLAVDGQGIGPNYDGLPNIPRPSYDADNIIWQED